MYLEQLLLLCLAYRERPTADSCLYNIKICSDNKTLTVRAMRLKHSDKHINDLDQVLLL